MKREGMINDPYEYFDIIDAIDDNTFIIKINEKDLVKTNGNYLMFISDLSLTFDVDYIDKVDDSIIIGKIKLSNDLLS